MRLGVVCALGLGPVATSVLVSLAPAGASYAAAFTAAIDDYPNRLKLAAQDSLVDPWFFYNRECTSFVAWRLNNNGGVAFNNYYLGAHWGDASNWANAARAAGVVVNNSPAPGAVAWWQAGSPGSSRGHVAWVHSASASVITIEEYNYLHTGGYDTRTISASSDVWPSGFIHLGDLRLRNTVRPVVSGVPQVGNRLSASRGSWTFGGADFSFQWLADGSEISGKTRKTLRMSAGLRGARIRVEVTATKAGMEPSSALSSPTPAVAAGVFANTEAPAISGTAQVGVTLRATKGTWSPRGTYAYHWYAGGVALRRATDATFTPSAAQVTKPITVRVTATRLGYRTANSTSRSTRAVVPGTFVSSAPPTISGTPQVGEPLTASPGTWSPTAKYRYRWFADGTPLANATSTTYTPVASDMRRRITVRVTARRPGYTRARISSSPTGNVAPGAFLNTRDPAIVGTARVGVRLRADPGAWSPRARISYQWYAHGDPVTGATDSAYTPTAANVGKTLKVRVTARRPGYLTAVVQSAATPVVAAGIIENLVPPEISGHLRVGSRLTASPGSWSVAPTSVSFQWVSAGRPIVGATRHAYVPTVSDAAHRLSVRVTVAADGYTPSAHGAEAVDVLLGDAAFARAPVIRGHAVVGRVLRVHTGALKPSYADTSYRWYRGQVAIHAANRAAYRPTAHDVGHRLSVRVTITAPDWAPATRRSEKTEIVR